MYLYNFSIVFHTLKSTSISVHHTSSLDRATDWNNDLLVCILLGTCSFKLEEWIKAYHNVEFNNNNSNNIISNMKILINDHVGFLDKSNFTKDNNTTTVDWDSNKQSTFLISRFQTSFLSREKSSISKGLWSSLVGLLLFKGWPFVKDYKKTINANTNKRKEAGYAYQQSNPIPELMSERTHFGQQTNKH